jgi:hypothetical protein
VKINSSQVALSTDKSQHSIELYKRQQTQTQTNTETSAQRQVFGDNSPFVNIATINEVNLSYQARMYSEQSAQSSQYSQIKQGDTQQTVETQRATHALTQTVIGAAVNIQNLRIDANTPSLVNPASSRTYNEVASLDVNQQDDELSVSATQSQTARLDIKEQYSLIEHERIQFGSQGKVTTEDGREIDFMLHLEMQRDFRLEQSLEIRNEERQLIDPLVINFDAPASSLTSASFSFDLNADGTQEQISFTGQGSGFLALDSNNDGRINDGSELFGTGELDGFGELAKYDNDNNLWIDENDEVFDKLKIWTKDDNGVDQLLSLKEAGVGAIYLGSSSSSFNLTDSENNLLGQVKRSGVFLKENGEAASIQELDIAVRNAPSSSAIDQSLQKIEQTVDDWSEQAAENNERRRFSGDLLNISDIETAAPVEEEQDSAPTLLDLLFPKPGSRFDRSEQYQAEKSVQSQHSTSTTQSVKGKLEEEDEQVEKVHIEQETIDVLQRLQDKTDNQLVQEQEQYGHLKAIIESLVKRHQESKDINDQAIVNNEGQRSTLSKKS